MSLMQKINIAAFVSGLAALGWYLSRLVPAFLESGVDAAWKWPMATSLIAFVVLLVAASIVIAVRDEDLRDEEARIDDERDHRAERRGDAWAGYVLQVFVLLALSLIFLDQHAFWIANTLYAGVMVGGAVGLIVRLMGGPTHG